MQIFFKGNTGQHFTLDVEPNDSIGSLKERLICLLNEGDSPFLSSSSFNRLSLIFAGKQLYEHDTVDRYNIRRENVIHFQYRFGNLDNFQEIINKTALSLFRKEVDLNREEKELIKNKNATIDEYISFANRQPESIIANKLLKHNVLVRRPGHQEGIEQQ